MIRIAVNAGMTTMPTTASGPLKYLSHWKMGR